MSSNADQYPPDRVILVLEVLPDPQARTLGPRYARSGDYRLRVALKWMLRGLGLKCVEARPALPGADNLQDLTPEAPRAA